MHKIQGIYMKIIHKNQICWVGSDHDNLFAFARIPRSLSELSLRSLINEFARWSR